MASPTKKLKVRRAQRKANQGKLRKARNRNQGSTAPRLPLDRPNANERLQKQQRDLS